MRAEFKRAGQFVTRHPAIISGVLAFVGDLLIPLFQDKFSYESTGCFLAGESGLIFLGRKPWGPALSYGLFAVGMELLRHSTGTANNPLLRLNLWGFSRIDVIWASQYLLSTAGIMLRKKGPACSEWFRAAAQRTTSRQLSSSYAFVADTLKNNSRSAGRALHRISDNGVLIAGSFATLLHLPGLAGSIGLSGPFNAIMLGGHMCWMAADALMGRVKEVGGLVTRAARKVFHNHSSKLAPL